jgi:predicted cupin superfamily sugar epimerase
MPPTSSFWIDRLRLMPHPGGGYTRATWRGSAEYILLESHQRLLFRRLRADEIWNFYSGSSLVLTVLRPGGELERIVVGDDPTEGEQYQAGIPAGCWLGVEVVGTGSYALAGRVSDTIAAGGEAEGDRDASDEASNDDMRTELLLRFPQHAAVIERFTGDEQG